MNKIWLPSYSSVVAEVCCTSFVSLKILCFDFVIWKLGNQAGFLFGFFGLFPAFFVFHCFVFVSVFVCLLLYFYSLFFKSYSSYNPN